MHLPAPQLRRHALTDAGTFFLLLGDELASCCLHTLAAASTLPSKAAVRRLVAVTLSGLNCPAATGS